MLIAPSWWRSASGREAFQSCRVLGSARASSEVADVTTAFSQLSTSTDRTLSEKSVTMKPVTMRPFLTRPAVRRRICISRSYAIQAPGNPTLQIFDRHTKYLQKERAAANVQQSRQVDYLKDEVAMRLSERLLVSLHSSIEPQILILKGHKSTFQSRPRPRSKLM